MEPNVDALLNQYEALVAKINTAEERERGRIRDRLAGIAEAWTILYPGRPSLQILVSQRRQREAAVSRLGFPGRST